eukprot:TRINITY_DN4908_c0_g1_i1.p1 TRINITY_DN4908_c0_g1~~TRINITY_DN4908_c0_g1_i1.p1  ORF type:complete len:346 (-),score=115.47 TRINITY_DN4908_c0_g1_i1:164-1201(-)
MPTHWYYNLGQLRADYGSITGYVKPRDKLPGSIMSLSNTGGGGRGGDVGEIIGTVINHGKKKYWGRGLDFHYHVGLSAGENTLEGQLARVLLRNIAANGGKVDPASFLQDYVRFMTTPGSHNDTYASTCHRMFFANFVRGLPPAQCPDNDGHNVDTIDALTLAVPAVVATVTEDGPSEAVRAAARSIVAMTRKSKVLPKYLDVFSDALASIISGKQTLEEATRTAGQRMGCDPIASAAAAWRKAGAVDREAYVGGDGTDPMVACYVDSSFPALLHFAARYGDVGPRNALLANANAGGENVGRGSALGALVGAAWGISGFPQPLRELHDGPAILGEIGAVAGPLAA